MIAEGSRVRLRNVVERYPHFIAPAGALGTVVTLDEEVLAVRLDEPLAGAEEWGNEVHWYAGAGMDEPELELDEVEA